MKRLVIRLSALTGIVVIGTIGIALLQRAVRPAQAAEAETADSQVPRKSAKPKKRAKTSAVAKPAAADPFADRRRREPAQLGAPTQAPEVMDPFAERTGGQSGDGQVAPAAEPTAEDSSLAPFTPGSTKAGVRKSRVAARPDPRDPDPQAAVEESDRYGRPLDADVGPSDVEPAMDDELPPEGEPARLSDELPVEGFSSVGDNSPAGGGLSGGENGAGRPGGKQLEGLQSPALSIEKTAPPKIQVGKPATFDVRVRNTGSVAAQAVEIHDEVPAGVELLSTRPQATRGPNGEVIWTLGALRPGEETSVQMEVMPTTEGEIGSVATVRFSSEATVRTVSTRPQLTIDVKAPSQVLIGDEITMSIRVSNPGTGAATHIVLSELIPDSLQHPAGPELEYEIGDLKPNESRTLSLTMKAVKPGTVRNVLAAKGEGQLQAEAETAFEIVAPELEVTMEGPKRRYLERQATYTVSISNPGTAAAKDVELVTHLPRGLKFVEANNAGQFDPQTNSVHWSLEELPPNETGSVTVTTLPIEAGEQTLRVEGTAMQGLAAEKEEVVLIEGVAAILFQVVDLVDPIEIGGETTFEIRVVNQGSKAANNVQILAVLPEELKPMGADGPARYEIDGQQVRFQPLERLLPKAETVFTVRAQGVQAGDVRVRVQLQTDEMRTPVTKEESTRVYADE